METCLASHVTDGRQLNAIEAQEGARRSRAPNDALAVLRVLDAAHLDGAAGIFDHAPHEEQPDTRPFHLMVQTGEHGKDLMLVLGWYAQAIVAHPQQQDAVMVVEDPNHPTTEMLPERWERWERRERPNPIREPLIVRHLAER